MIEHCVSALIVLAEEETYRAYVANALKVIAYNTSGQETRQLIKYSYSELIDRGPKEERTAEDVINHVTEKIMGVRDEPTSTGGEDIP